MPSDTLFVADAVAPGPNAVAFVPATNRIRSPSPRPIRRCYPLWRSRQLQYFQSRSLWRRLCYRRHRKPERYLLLSDDALLLNAVSASPTLLNVVPLTLYVGAAIEPSAFNAAVPPSALTRGVSWLTLTASFVCVPRATARLAGVRVTNGYGRSRDPPTRSCHSGGGCGGRRRCEPSGRLQARASARDRTLQRWLERVSVGTHGTCPTCHRHPVDAPLADSSSGPIETSPTPVSTCARTRCYTVVGSLQHFPIRSRYRCLFRWVQE